MTPEVIGLLHSVQYNFFVLASLFGTLWTLYFFVSRIYQGLMKAVNPPAQAQPVPEQEVLKMEPMQYGDGYKG